MRRRSAPALTAAARCSALRSASDGAGRTLPPMATESRRRKLIVVSNRGPIGYGRDEEGQVVAQRGAGGLVTALAPLVSHHDVTWIASAISPEDREIAATGSRQETARDGSRYRLR